MQLSLVWPDAEILSRPNISKSCRKSSYSSLCKKMDVFKTAQTVNIHLGYFCKKICHQELSKIAQSGHTGAIFNLVSRCFLLLSAANENKKTILVRRHNIAFYYLRIPSKQVAPKVYDWYFQKWQIGVSYRYLLVVWPDWVIFESSWWQIILQK